METFVAKVFSKHYDSGLLSIVHRGDNNSHFGVDQILQNEFNCGIFVVGSQLPPPVPATLQLPWLVENMYITCQTLVTGFQSSGMSDRLLHKLSHGLGKAIVGCEKFMTFFNNLHNDPGLIPPLDPLMQVQKPTEIPKASCENLLFPWLSFLNVLLATAMLVHSLYWMCRPLTCTMVMNSRDVVLYICLCMMEITINPSRLKP